MGELIMNFTIHLPFSLEMPDQNDLIVPKKLKMIKYEHTTNKVQLRTEIIVCQLYYFFLFLKIRTSDFSDFDYIIGMDDDNMR